MASTSSSIADFLGRHSRKLTLAAVASMALVGWGWLVVSIASGRMAGGMGIGMGALAPLFERIALWLPGSGGAAVHGGLMPSLAPWGARDIALVLAMWAAMVFAMMLPTAAPTFRAYALKGASVSAAVMAGYTSVWLAIAVVGTLGQTGLTYLGVLTPHMAPAGTALSASILIAAGIYQFTPLKLSCLIRCRNPYVTDLDNPSVRVALQIGIEEGIACLGCCWAMMAVMFAAGMMNLVAMAFLGALMGAEKLLTGLKFTYFLGGTLMILGMFLASGLFLR
jgi:predicted metal-binding membrane protein